MQLATAVDDQPWVCNVWFAADDHLNVYWFSAINRRHSLEVEKNPLVAACGTHMPPCSSLPGRTPLTVKQRMGHSSITVTMDRYGHLFPHLEEGITERMDDAYREVHMEPLQHADSTDGSGHDEGSVADES